MKRNKKGFTLIELIAVLVIMAILALIVTPLVMSIIKKAKLSADKRSIDAYGRSIELAIAGYLLDNGTFPTSISELAIEYRGDEVECTTTQLNSDLSVYLAGCTVAGRTVDYEYGEDATPTYTSYSIGDEVNYNNVDYYVIKDSGVKEETVTLLKKDPLTVAEVNTYGAGHVNRYTGSSVGTAYDSNGYGGMAYYSNETCGHANSFWIYDGCTTDYVQSEIKYVVDAWKVNKAPMAVEARLITYDELTMELGCDNNNCMNSSYNWLYNKNYWYWTMNANGDSMQSVWGVFHYGYLFGNGVYGDNGVIRPVIVLSKSVLSN